MVEEYHTSGMQKMRTLCGTILAMMIVASAQAKMDVALGIGNGVSSESKGSRLYDKKNLLWQFTVAIRSWLCCLSPSSVRNAIHQLAFSFSIHSL
jgi:hypothetical protein